MRNLNLITLGSERVKVGYPVSEHSTILCRCPGISARALSVDVALERCPPDERVGSH